MASQKTSRDNLNAHPRNCKNNLMFYILCVHSMPCFVFVFVAFPPKVLVGGYQFQLDLICLCGPYCLYFHNKSISIIIRNSNCGKEN